MGIPSSSRRSSPPIHSPKDSETAILDATVSGFKSAVIAGIVASGPVLIGCRVIPWAKAHINYTGQALLISSAAISAFFIAADKTIMARAHKDSVAKLEKTS